MLGTVAAAGGPWDPPSSTWGGSGSLGCCVPLPESVLALARCLVAATALPRCPSHWDRPRRGCGEPRGGLGPCGGPGGAGLKCNNTAALGSRAGSPQGSSRGCGTPPCPQGLAPQRALTAPQRKGMSRFFGGEGGKGQSSHVCMCVLEGLWGFLGCPCCLLTRVGSIPGPPHIRGTVVCRGVMPERRSVRVGGASTWH